MTRRKWWTRTLAVALSAVLLPCFQTQAFANAALAGEAQSVQAQEAADEAQLPVPAYLWDFEDVAGGKAANKGSAEAGDASLHGANSVQAGISIGDKSYSQEGNFVLDLAGGSKGSSYADLPSNLYEGVSAQTGFTWSFWMKPDAGIVSYSRLLSSSNSSNRREFAYAPYAADKVWNLIFDDDGNKYRQIYGTEPQKGVWSYVTVTVSGDKVVLYVNGDESASNAGEGNADNLKARLNEIAGFTNHALGKTTSTYGDKDAKAQLDDVAFYKTALTAEQVMALAKSYGLEPAGPRLPQDAQEGLYGTARKPLAQVPELTAASDSGADVVKIWKDEESRYYYSVSRNGKTVIECSALGLATKAADLTSGMELDAASIQKEAGRETYGILQGSVSKVDKKYQELSFDLRKGNSKVTVIFRVFEDGMAYRYKVDGDTASTAEVTTVTGEASEFMLPDKGTIWTINMSQTYEGRDYTKRSMDDQYAADTPYSTPILASLGEDSGNAWVLLSEANRYNEAEPYAASIFKTEAGSKAFRIIFGQRLDQEEDASMNKKKYSAKYSFITEARMKDVFQTPWRTAVIASDLEGVANSSLFMDLNPAPAKDFSWVEPGASVWSWWSSSYDAIEYKTMVDYIDFAAEAGMKYCLVDYGWELWDGYKEKIASLVEYANKKDVGLLLWYGVNKFDGEHIFDLDCQEAIEEEFAWCEQVGVKGVKVDYINSDSQFAMKVMYMLADIAADHHLVVNYHGCVNPGGENRTYPNILSSEAVAGMENYKWNNGPNVASLLTLPYTRNVLGSMEFTPTAYRVQGSNATSGLMLAMSVVYESAIQTFAHSAFVYQGYKGLSLLADVPTTWDDSKLIEGYPGESVIRARKKGDNWYLGAMTLDAKTYNVPLTFLDSGQTYHAYIYKDNAAGDNIEVTSQDVTSATVLPIPLLANGGCSVKFTKNDPMKTTVYDEFNYYEAEDANCAVFAGEVRAAGNKYASNLQHVGYVGGKPENTLTFPKVNVPEDGDYALKVYYAIGSPRDLTVKVNGGEPIKLNGLVGYTNDALAVVAVSLDVALKKGDNSVCLYNDESYAPDIDRIAVSKQPISGGEVAVEKVVLSQAEISLKLGDAPVALTATVIPENATDKTIVWSSINEKVAAVDKDGKVTPVAKGEAVITAKAGAASAACKVTVSEAKPPEPPIVEVAAVKLDKASLTLTEGDKPIALKVTVEPGNASNKEITWSSSNGKAASVDQNGIVTPLSKGQAEIRATASNGKSAACKVTVNAKRIPVKKITLNKKKATIGVGEAISLKATVSPSNADKAFKKVTWKSSNKNASVSNGKVKAKKAGTVKITATAGGKSASCVVTIQKAPKKVTAKKKSITLRKKDTYKVRYTLSPSKSRDKVTYKSSNAKVAKVSSKGVVKALKKGKATITIKTYNNKKAAIKVLVK